MSVFLVSARIQVYDKILWLLLLIMFTCYGFVLDHFTSVGCIRHGYREILKDRLWLSEILKDFFFFGGGGGVKFHGGDV